MTMFKCYSSRLAGELISKGHKLLKTETNYIKPQYNVYLFEDTEEVRDIFDNYCKSKGQHK